MVIRTTTTHDVQLRGYYEGIVRVRVRLSGRPVQRFVASGAQSDQVQVVVVALLAPQFLVVDMQILPGTTELASPPIATQYLFSELVIRFWIKPQARPLGPNPLHEAFSANSWRKACRCSPGRNFKNRDMDRRSAVGSSFSRFAPARKSAQIISRQ